MLKVYNTKSHSLEQFIPIHENEVKMYGCGPTVYNYAHIGNLRAYMFYDLLNRYLRYKGFKVTFAMNLTDVDDKTIRDSAKAGLPLREFTQKYADIFFNDLKTLNIKPADIIIRATDEIPAMIELIQLLLDKGFAYKAKSGDIFFKISMFPQYGQMAGIKQIQLRENADGRLADEYEKEDAQDFALWKAWKEEDGANVWEAPFGRGRPGWHIECSAMSHKYLGQPFDIHIGGVDLIFPHHTNEIAQSECAYGCEFVRYWMHNEHITVNGEKMSKSHGTCYYLKDLLEKGYSAAAIRYEFLKAHYRMRMDFNEGNMEGNQKVIDKFHDFLSRLEAVSTGDGWNGLFDALKAVTEGFETGLDNDLNMSQALAAIFDFMSEVNKNFAHLSRSDAEQIKNQLLKFDEVLGFIENKEKKELSPEQQKLIDERQQYRLAKDWAKADELKKILLNQGIEIKDTPTGPVIKFI